jgi:hypothetical protein
MLIVRPSDGVSSANDDIPSRHHRAKKPAEEQSTRFPRCTSLVMRKLDRPLSRPPDFFTVQHLKTSEGEYLSK